MGWRTRTYVTQIDVSKAGQRNALRFLIVYLVVYEFPEKGNAAIAFWENTNTCCNTIYTPDIYVVHYYSI